MKKSLRFPARYWSCMLVLVTASMLAACYVMPIDPRTGQAYPVQSQQQVVPAVYVPINTNTIFQAKLYPINDQARKAGVLTATATDTNNGRGVFNVIFMGENLVGDASRVDASAPGFGRIYKEVLGANSEKVATGRYGIANAYGSNGAGVQCEYQMTSKDMETGACLFSNGAKYQMHFGG